MGGVLGICKALKHYKENVLHIILFDLDGLKGLQMLQTKQLRIIWLDLDGLEELQMLQMKWLVHNLA